MTTPRKEVGLLKVGGGSSAKSVASAIAHSIYETRGCTLRAIGAGAVSQTVKALTIARGYTAPRGLDLVWNTGFDNVESVTGDASTITAITFYVKVA